MKPFCQFLSILYLLIACENNDTVLKENIEFSSIKEQKDTVTKPKKKQEYISALKENQLLKKNIKSKYGEQFSFCTCIEKGDSLNKALKNSNLSDDILAKLLKRFDEIDRKCQAFRLNDANATPRERQMYKKSVKQCLE